MPAARTASAYLMAFALLLLGACSAGEDAANQTVEGPMVRVVEVQPQFAAGAIRASGMVGYKREPQLAFAAPGVVADIAVDAGDVVRRGERLATLRRTSVGSNADEAALASANAERDLARTQELFERGFVSQARLDDARLAAERARASSVLIAPASGVILRRTAEVSQTVAAGAPIFTFGDTASGLIVRAPVASADAARIAAGDAAVVRIAGVALHQGRVTRVGAKGNDGTGAFEVEIEIANAGALRSGTVAEVEVTASGAAGAAPAIIVPALSLLDARADQGAVFVVDAEGVARRRAVRTAGVTQEGVLVVEGLAAGDRVIAAGAAYVRDGESVRVMAGS
jgi:RND family efflux transporter MFP subunit